MTDRSISIEENDTNIIIVQITTEMQTKSKKIQQYLTILQQSKQKELRVKLVRYNFFPGFCIFTCSIIRKM